MIKSVVKHFRSVLQRGSYGGVLRAPANSPVWECDFNEAVRQLNWNHTSAWVFSCGFATYFPEHLFIRAPLRDCFGTCKHVNTYCFFMRVNRKWMNEWKKLMNINKLWRKIEKTFKLKLDSAGNVINLIRYSFSKAAYEI